MYMDDIKLFAQNKREMETLIKAETVYSRDIGIEFGIEKCAMQIMKSGKRYITDGTKLTNQEKIRTVIEKETYVYLRTLEGDMMKQVEMNEKKKRIIFENPECYSRQNYWAETL